MKEMLATLSGSIDGHAAQLSQLLRALRLRQTAFGRSGAMRGDACVDDSQQPPVERQQQALDLAALVKNELCQTAELIATLRSTPAAGALSATIPMREATDRVEALCQQLERQSHGPDVLLGYNPPANAAVTEMFASFVKHCLALLHFGHALLKSSHYELRSGGVSEDLLNLARIVNDHNQNACPHINCGPHCYKCSEVRRLLPRINEMVQRLDRGAPQGLPADAWWRSRGLLYAEPGTGKLPWERDEDVSYPRILLRCGDRP